MTEADKIILDMVMQHCHVTEGKTVWYIDNSCLSSDEQATMYLERIGILKNKRRGRVFSLSKKVEF